MAFPRHWSAKLQPYPIPVHQELGPELAHSAAEGADSGSVINPECPPGLTPICSVASASLQCIVKNQGSDTINLNYSTSEP